MPIVAALAVALGTAAERRRVRNEASAIQRLRSLVSVQGQIYEGERDYLSSVDQLSSAGFTDRDGLREGYRLAPSAITNVFWEGRATPIGPRTGSRNFYVCTDGVVRVAEPGETADSSSRPLR